MVFHLRHILYITTDNVPYTRRWVEGGRQLSRTALPPFPTCLSLGTSLYLYIETGHHCNLQVSHLNLPTARLQLCLTPLADPFHQFSPFSQITYLHCHFFTVFSRVVLTAPVEDERPFFFLFLTHHVSGSLASWLPGSLLPSSLHSHPTFPASSNIVELLQVD